MKTGILLDENNGQYRIQERADSDWWLPAFGFWLDPIAAETMRNALGVTDDQLASALTNAKGVPFTDERGKPITEIVPPDRDVKRYVFRIRGDVMDVIVIEANARTTVIGTSPQDSVITQADWTLIKAQLGVASDAEALRLYALAHGATVYPDRLESEL